MCSLDVAAFSHQRVGTAWTRLAFVHATWNNHKPAFFGLVTAERRAAATRV